MKVSKQDKDTINKAIRLFLLVQELKKEGRELVMTKEGCDPIVITFDTED